MGFAIAGAAVVGGLISANGAENAANTMSDASKNAAGMTWAQYQQTRDDNAPWREAGSSALGQLESDLPDLNKPFSATEFQSDPGYAFRLQQGQQAIERSAAARGGLDSGATMKALNDYSQGEATQDYQQAYQNYNTDNTNTFNRLASIAGLGQTANNTNAAAGATAATAAGNATVGAANATAAGQVGTANAVNGAIGNGMNSWMNYTMMNNANQPPSGGAVPGYSMPNNSYLGTGSGGAPGSSELSYTSPALGQLD